MTTGRHGFLKLPEWLSLAERAEVSSLTQNAIWEQGRQGTGYEKFNIRDEVGARWVIDRALKVIHNPIDFDAWLLHYPVGSEIPPHTDPSDQGMCHVRLNALVIAGAGGILCLEGEEQPLSEGDAYIFRPDITTHSVTSVKESSRLILSVGANVEQEQAQAIGLA